MSIFPPTDLVIDVGRAADPSKRAAAIQRLERLSSPGPDAGSLPASHPDHFIFTNIHPTLSSSRPSDRLNIDAGRPDSVSAVKKFEAFLLQTWLEVLLPKIDGGAYGNDHAGGVWRTLMAEQLGDQLAKSDCLGISRLIDHSSTIDKEKKS